MNQDTETKGKSQLAKLSFDEGMSAEQLIDRVLAADNPLDAIQGLLDRPDLGNVGDAQSELRLALESLGSFLLGNKLLTNANLLEARDHLHAAAEGFNHIGASQPRDLAVGLSTYCDAALAIAAMNVGLARELLAQAQDYLRKAGKLAQSFEGLIAHMQPEALFVQAVEAVMKLDFETAQPLIIQASQAAEKVATEFYSKDTPEYFFWLGYAHYFKATYTVFRINRDFNRFAYDSLSLELDFDKDAVQARDLWAAAPMSYPMARNLSYLNNGYLELLGLMRELTRIMKMVFNSTFRADSQIFEALRQKIRKANDVFAQAGPAASTSLRMCDQLVGQIANLERLTAQKPIEISDPIRVSRQKPRLAVTPRQRKRPAKSDQQL